MKIEKFEKLKNNKYKLIIDGESIITFDDLILEYNLLYKKEIDKELYDLIVNESIYYEIYNKTFKYILKKRRSEHEIIEYLSKYELREEQIEKMILKFKNNNLINDKQYCKAFINDSLNLSNSGINKIRIELIKKGIANNIIEEELEYIDKSILDGKLKKIIFKKINSNKKYSNNYLKQKILNEMIILGYDKHIVLSILENSVMDNKKVIEKEFDKLYKRLSKKYDGDNLYTNIKSKLLSKGFSYDEINEIIKKTEE